MTISTIFKISGRRGSILLMTMMFMFALVVFVVVFINTVIYSQLNAARQLNSSQAFYLAEAGVNKAMWYLLNTAPDASIYGTWRTTAYPAAAGAGPTDPRSENLTSGSYTMWVEDYAPDSSIYITGRSTVNQMTRVVYQRVRMGPVGWWKFDDAASGTMPITAADSSGRGNTGTYVNDPAWTAGKVGVGALSFNGSSSYLTRTTFNNPPRSNLTVCAWIKTACAGECFILSLGRTAASIAGECVWEVYSNHKMVFWDWDSGYGFPAGAGSNTGVNDGAWHHVCFVKSGGTGGKYYLDGLADGTSTAAKDVSYNGNYALVIGSNMRDNNLYFSGTMDDVRLYNRALSSIEIAQIYAGDTAGSGFTPVPNSWGEK